MSAAREFAYASVYLGYWLRFVYSHFCTYWVGKDGVFKVDV